MNDQRLFVLESFGLSGYLARAYVALLDLGPAQARDIADRSAVPQGRIYDVLEKLHARGLVELLPEAPKRYRAVAFDTFIERELSFHNERARLLERQRDDILTTMKPREEPRPEAAEYLVVRGRRAVAERIAALVGESADVLVLGTEQDGQRLGQFEDVFRAAAGRGARVRIMLPVSKANRAAIEQAASWGVEVRHRPSASALTLYVFDGARALLHRGSAEPGSKGLDATSLLLGEPAMAQGLRDIGERTWLRAVGLRERLQELDTGRRSGDVAVFRRLDDVRAALGEALGETARELRVQAPGDILGAAFPGLEQAVRGLVERKVRVRVLASARASGDQELLRRLGQLGAEVRSPPEIVTAYAVRDDAEAFLMVAELVRRTASGQATGELVVWADGADFVESLAAQFDAAWSRATGERSEPRLDKGEAKLPPA